MSTTSIEAEIHDRTLLVTVNRPQAMNALDVPAMREFRSVVGEFNLDPALRVCVLTGAGERAFCTGSDLKNTPLPAASFAEAYFQPTEASIEAGMYVRAVSLNQMGVTKPLIAAINGYALGGGLEIALDCDLRIASTTASFGLPEARWASVPGINGVSRLLRAVPRAVAMQMLLTGAPIDAAEAHRVGLVSEVLAPADLVPRALELAETIAFNGPLAVASIKALADRTGDLTLSQSIAMEQLLWGQLRDTEDRTEGRHAFAEKRAPDYHGK